MAGRSTRSSPTALITGASSGLGAALAVRFARAGHRLVLVARRAARLRALAAQLGGEFGVHALPLAADLARPSAAARIAAALRRRRLTVDVLVNNAGVLEQGSFARMPAARHRELIAVNVAAPTALIAQFLPGMIRRGRGRILNVASISAFQPVPTLAAYAASKAFLLSLSEALAEEVRGTGVTVTALCPGIIDTPMLGRARRAHASLRRLPGLLVGDVEAVAAAGYLACVAGDALAVPGAVNVAATTAAQAAPRWVLRRIAGAIGRRML